jgi:hypothetical protein
MKALLLAAVASTILSSAVQAAEATGNASLIRRCITAAAAAHRVPPAVLVILLNVEGGSLGHVSGNTNDTVDIGPMQVNQTWIPDVAAHWHATPGDTFRALRDNFCANVEAGAWILRQGLDEARGDFWEGVAYYHSHTPRYKRDYLQSVLRQIVRLQALSQRTANAPRASVVAGE